MSVTPSQLCPAVRPPPRSGNPDGARPWLVGLAVAVLMAAAAAAILVLRRYSASSALIAGEGALVAGLLGVLADANVASLSLLLASSALAGIGFGAAYLGALGSIASLAEGDQADLPFL